MLLQRHRAAWQEMLLPEWHRAAWQGTRIGKSESGKAPHLFQGLVVAKVLRLPLQKLMNVARINAG
jgi:hypothetical protein